MLIGKKSMMNQLERDTNESIDNRFGSDGARLLSEALKIKRTWITLHLDGKDFDSSEFLLCFVCQERL